MTKKEKEKIEKKNGRGRWKRKMKTHVGIPIMCFKAPARSCRPKYSIAMAEAWPDPSPITIPVFT